MLAWLWLAIAMAMAMMFAMALAWRGYGVMKIDQETAYDLL